MPIISDNYDQVHKKTSTNSIFNIQLPWKARIIPIWEYLLPSLCSIFRPVNKSRKQNRGYSRKPKVLKPKYQEPKAFSHITIAQYWKIISICFSEKKPISKKVAEMFRL
ncbi:hypothetical protein CKF54_05015, partial [Psittacicella hinzii]